jgi:hypothetical protein
MSYADSFRLDVDEAVESFMKYWTEPPRGSRLLSAMVCTRGAAAVRGGAGRSSRADEAAGRLSLRDLAARAEAIPRMAMSWVPLSTPEQLSELLGNCQAGDL